MSSNAGKANRSSWDTRRSKVARPHEHDLLKYADRVMAGAIAEEPKSVFVVHPSAIIDYEYFPSTVRNGVEKKSVLHKSDPDRASR